MVKETAIFNDIHNDVTFIHTISDACDIDIHLHDSYEIFMAMSDNIRYHIEGRAYDLKSGDIIITNEKEIHRPVTVNSDKYDRRFIQFKPYVFTAFFSKSYNPLSIFDNRELGTFNKLALNKQNDNNVNKIFDEIEKTNQVKTAKNRLLIKSLTVQLLINLEELYHKSAHSNDSAVMIDKRVSNIINELDVSYNKPFSLDDLSKKYFMDKYYLCHLFKQATGFSLLEYVQSKRIQHAKMLIHKGLSITESSILCGFDEYSNFYKTFRKLVKISPKKYKDSMNILRNSK